MKLTSAGKLAFIIELMETPILTGKRGRPKKMLTKKQALKVLGLKDEKKINTYPEWF